MYRIVGNDDGGVPFTPEQYENYKREVLPMVLKISFLFVCFYFECKYGLNRLKAFEKPSVCSLGKPNRNGLYTNRSRDAMFLLSSVQKSSDRL